MNGQKVFIYLIQTKKPPDYTSTQRRLVATKNDSKKNNSPTTTACVLCTTPAFDLTAAYCVDDADVQSQMKNSLDCFFIFHRSFLLVKSRQNENHTFLSLKLINSVHVFQYYVMYFFIRKRYRQRLILKFTLY